MIVASLVAEPQGGGPLRWAPLAWLGRRSYAIYLFHWPLLVLYDGPAAVAIGASLGLAELSHRLVEAPVRNGRALRRPVLSLGLATVVLAVAVGGVMVMNDEGDVAAEVAAATRDALAAAEPEPRPPVSEPITAGTVGPAAAATERPAGDTAPDPVGEPILLPPTPDIALVGDSTGVRLEPALTGWVEALGGNFTSYATSACSPAFGDDPEIVWEVRNVITNPGCRPLVAPGADLVLVMDGAMVMLDHFDPLRGVWTVIYQPEFADVVRSEYESYLAEAEGLVVFITPPPSDWSWLPADERDAAQRRLVAYVELIDELAAAHDNALLLDLGPTVLSDPERYVRSDGLHLDFETGAVNFVIDLVVPAFRVANDETAADAPSQ